MSRRDRCPQTVAGTPPPFVHSRVGDAFAFSAPADGVAPDGDCYEKARVALAQLPVGYRIRDELTDLFAGIDGSRAPTVEFRPAFNTHGLACGRPSALATDATEDIPGDVGGDGAGTSLERVVEYPVNRFGEDLGFELLVDVAMPEAFRHVDESRDEGLEHRARCDIVVRRASGERSEDPIRARRVIAAGTQRGDDPGRVSEQTQDWIVGPAITDETPGAGVDETRPIVIDRTEETPGHEGPPGLRGPGECAWDVPLDVPRVVPVDVPIAVPHHAGCPMGPARDSLALEPRPMGPGRDSLALEGCPMGLAAVAVGLVLGRADRAIRWARG